ncbi:MAG: DUF4268 domain-containing protein [Oscillospiraceae bacterium]|nr:DUF4268 domain-containing protein [Oscillospiraceae bacterium]
MTLGKLTEVDIRELWEHEQYDFSEWLSQDQNIEYLNEMLGLNLIDVRKEVFVGAYRCDLVAKDETSDITIIIENQLECSNHEHLGKIITYASGLNAKVIVWIVKEAREEHRSAIEWLNSITDSDLNFFLIEIHAYKIGNSDPAPKFEIIEEPNGFRKNTKGTSGSNENNKTRSERLIFWNEFYDVLSANGNPFKIKKDTNRHYNNIGIGSSKAWIGISLVDRESKIGVELYISDNKELYDSLYACKDEIENKLTFSADWRRLDDKKASRIIHYINGLNFDDHSNYNELMLEIIEKVKVMKNVFTKYIN